MKVTKIHVPIDSVGIVPSLNRLSVTVGTSLVPETVPVNDSQRSCEDKARMYVLTTGQIHGAYAQDSIGIGESSGRRSDTKGLRRDGKSVRSTEYNRASDFEIRNIRITTSI